MRVGYRGGATRNQESDLHILFVCTGNICRSPTGERLAAAAGIAGLTTSSAGTRAVIGHPVHPEAARVLTNLGGTADGFAARQLTPRIAAEADLVLAMTAAHRDAVLELAPRQLRRTFTLTEAAVLAAEHDPAGIADLGALRPQLSGRAVPDIADPIGRDAAYFDTVGAEIAAALAPVLRLCGRSCG
jgi:protein-tyrosine phosphatase